MQIFHWCEYQTLGEVKWVFNLHHRHDMDALYEVQHTKKSHDNIPFTYIVGNITISQ